ncbi:hypothetical protein [Pseudonocardia sp.]|uniref:hypothetical protein n=1 Tax=Pseudonocardia sp. TaxID=60912 RepID=UPI003D0CC33C
MSITRTGRAHLDVPCTDIDLTAWIFGLSDAEYQACARGHRAAGVFADEEGRGTVNVEAIGGNLVIQHYRAVRTERDGVEMHSAASRVYLLHLVPVTATVGWWLAAAPTGAATSELTCTVEVGLHPVVQALGRLMALGTFLRRHVEEETQLFAADIERKTRRTRTGSVTTSSISSGPDPRRSGAS